MTEWCINNDELNSALSVMKIVEGTSVDGTGLRTSIYFAGCNHKCKGCQNPQTWDISHGQNMTIQDILEIIELNDFNVTFSGGDPLYQMPKIIPLAKAIKLSLNKTIWCYTGYTIEQIENSAELREILQWVDVIVDGPYIEALRDTSLHFRGSSNQHVIYLTEK